MIDSAADARQAVDAWLRLDVDDPACNDARATIDALGRDELQRAAGVAAGWGSIRAADQALAEAMKDLASELRELEPGHDDRGLLARVVSKLPGVGSAAERRALRLASARPRLESMVRVVDGERAVLSRDNVTLRSDLERMHEMESELVDAMRRVQAYEDALVFAVDVEVPELDPRRTLFEDELLAGCRLRVQELEAALATNAARIEATETAMAANRSVIREIEALTRTASKRLETR